MERCVAGLGAERGRFAAMIASLVLLFAAPIVAQTHFQRADVNGSGGIDVVDVQLVVNLILGSVQPSSPTQGDANGDGNVDVVDVQTVVNWVLIPYPTPPFILGTPSTTTVAAGTLWSFTPVIVGTPMPVLTLAPGAPSWLSLNGNVLSGTPTNADAGTVTFTLVATNGMTDPRSREITLVIEPRVAPLIFAGTVPHVIPGVIWSYTPGLGGIPMPTLSLGPGAPTWMSCNGTAVYGLVPASLTGNLDLTLIASNGVVPAAQQLLSVPVVVNPTAPQITAIASQSVIAGNTWSYTVSASGNPAPTLALTALTPPWVSLTGNVISANPTVANVGSHIVGVSAINGVSPNGSVVFHLSVDPPPTPPVFFPIAQQIATEGSAWSLTPAFNGTIPITVSLGPNAPGWMTSNGSTVSGTPGAADVGSFTVELVATNAAQQPVSATFSMWVLAMGTPPRILGTPPPYAEVGKEWVFTPVIVGAPMPTVQLGTGAPAWVTWNGTTLRGTPGATDVGGAGMSLVASNGTSTPLTHHFGTRVVTSATGTVGWAPMNYSGTVNSRFDHSAVYTGSELFVFCGRSSLQSFDLTARSLNLSTLAWRNTFFSNGTPTGKSYGPANQIAWTGFHVFLWGAADAAVPLNEGVLVETNMPTVCIAELRAQSPTLAPRVGNASVWTGTGCFVWGGVGNGPTYFGDGGLCSPFNTTWTSVSQTGAPSPRAGSMSVAWTGAEALIWGGENANGLLADGGAYDLTHQAWRTISTVGAPSARKNQSVIWASTRMIVWGGEDANGNPLGDGASYDPFTNTWTPISSLNAPLARKNHTAVWTGKDMIVWGGMTSAGAVSATNTGAIYNIANDTWSPMPLTGVPDARSRHTAVWDGTRMIIFGGMLSSGAATNTGSFFTPP